MKNLNVAILGATGLVGRTFIKVLEERSFPVSNLKLLASERSSGTVLSFRGEDIKVEKMTLDSFKGIDIALFSAGSSISREIAKEAASMGTTIIDNSSAWRMEPDVPLVVPEVNPGDIEFHQGIIANPNCSTIQMVVALAPIHSINPIQRVIVSTYQATSGAGAAGLKEMLDQTNEFVSGSPIEPNYFPHQIVLNAIPQIDSFQENDYTGEEMKLVNETKKILHSNDIKISATAVRIPVATAHSESIHIELSQPFTAEAATKVLNSAPGITIIDNPTKLEYPMAINVAGQDQVFIGRIRQDLSFKNGLAMWVVADNIRKGAATNAVQIAELVAKLI